VGPEGIPLWKVWGMASDEIETNRRIGTRDEDLNYHFEEWRKEAIEKGKEVILQSAYKAGADLFMSDYNELVEFLRTLPMTWYPALLMEMVRAAYKKKVFKPHMASQCVKDIEEKFGL
jgi:hypothetical protein